MNLQYFKCSCLLLVLLLMLSQSFMLSPRDEAENIETHSPRLSILFMLSSLAISGGNISILQEAIEMRRKGMRVSVAVSQKYVPNDYVSLIMALSSSVSEKGVKDLVIIYDGDCCWPKSAAPKLVQIAQDFDIVVATYHTTAFALPAIVQAHPHIMPAYYVQDYEPWFTCSPFDCPFKNKLTFFNRWLNKPLVTKETHFKYTASTYTAVSGQVFLFAKTDWIKRIVESHHRGTLVHRVIPSIDHTVYFPENGSLALKAKVARLLPLSLQSQPSSAAGGRTATYAAGIGRVKIIAMLRPRTPRRNSLECLDVMLRLAHNHPLVLQVSLFGVDARQLADLLADLVAKRGHARHRSSKNVKVLGLLKQRRDLAKVYRASDLFVDMSWWQAFGRTAVEAMACGCVPVMPAEGAGSYVCDEGRVCRYHDGRDAAGYYDAVVSLVYNHTERLRMVTAGIDRTKEFSIRRAATSIESVLSKGMDEYRRKHQAMM